jgi:ECF transporter S component (folate family)
MKNQVKNKRKLDYIRRITIDAMLIAMYFVLDGISLKLNDYMKLTFNSFAIIICVVLFGMLDACIVAGIGEFLIQIKFIGPFLPLFVLVQLVRALIMGAFAEVLYKSKVHFESKPLWVYASCLVSGLATSALNSVVLFAYSNGMDYAQLLRVPAWWWAMRIPSFTSTFFTAAVLATAAIPVARALRKAGIGRKIISEDTAKE